MVALPRCGKANVAWPRRSLLGLTLSSLAIAIRETVSGLARRPRLDSAFGVRTRERFLMNRFAWFSAAALFALTHAPTTFAATSDQRVREAIVGDAMLNNAGYALLERMTMRYGPRMAGTEGSARSMDLLENALRELAIETRRERFTIPGWTRGNDQVALVSPPARQLRAAALGYCQPHEPIEAEVSFVESMDFDQMDAGLLRGKVALFAPNLRIGQSDYRRLAEDFGVVGGLLINRVNGGQLLARTANHEGTPPPFPVYSITVEEGRWMQGQIEMEMPVRVRIETQSTTAPITIDNLIAVLPGTSGETIVVGGHFDSWDMGQGAIDQRPWRGPAL